MLTELEAWEHMAERWDHAERGVGFLFGVPTLNLTFPQANGLCDTLFDMEKGELVSEETSLSCYKSINEYRKQSGIATAFLWPLTKEGASARAAFCRHQAALIREKTQTQAKEESHA